MNTRKDFESAFLKIERADHHVQQFEAIVRRYVMDNVKTLRPNPNPKKRKERAIGGRIPRHTPTIVGDAIHNLRTSLDHAYCALVEANGGTIVRWTKFPFGDTRENTEATINGQKATSLPSADVLKFIIEEIKPFEIGGSEIHGVHRLDIADKHHSLIATNASMAIDDLAILDGGGKRIGGFTGLTLTTPYPNQGGSLALAPDLTAKLYGDPRTTFDIRFGKGQPFENESIVNTLKRLSVVTRDALIALSKF